jgi:hypothetical protein
MELLTFNTDISSFYPHILRNIHAQFNTIFKDKRISLRYTRNIYSAIKLILYQIRFETFFLSI